MNGSIIKSTGIGKKYIICHQQSEKYTALRDVIAKKTRDWIKKERKISTVREEFWALKNISFDIKRGEAVGIIGRNGAGKSTLLKVLSRITDPTTGRLEINGRVASLLEVGTGFHPELTGRENVFLNGAILGMSRLEIKRKFDEIIEFAGVEKFLDTPVKRYSSGMYVRLAFAVAAHLEPEILVIDEVLAVGDAEFQKKCIGKMDEVSKGGRTVLFVSHNMGVIAELCKSCILLDKGQIQMHDKTEVVLDRYSVLLSNTFSLYQSKSVSNSALHIKSISAQSRSGNNIFSFNEKIMLKIELTLSTGYFEGIHLGIALLDKWKRKIFTTHKLLEGDKKLVYILSIPEQLFLGGYYSFDAALFVPNSSVFEYLKDICPFEILDFSSNMAQYANADTGIMQVKCEWS